METSAAREDLLIAALRDHDYAAQFVAPKDIPIAQELSTNNPENEHQELEGELEDENPRELFTKKLSKCDLCRRSRSKVILPESVLSVARSNNDGVTCDFCGDVMSTKWPENVEEQVQQQQQVSSSSSERTTSFSSSNGDEDTNDSNGASGSLKKKNYVYCGECGKIVLQVSLLKHVRDVHELSNKKQCHICNKILSGPFSLKEHISVIHNEQRDKFQCTHCYKQFAHLTNLNRHIRLIHDKMVVTQKYVNCSVCNKVVQCTSLKKHMASVHEQRKDFKCKYCDKSFTQSYTLKEHTTAKHTFQFKQRCRICGKSFAHKTNCFRHLKTVHKSSIMGKYASEKDMLKACMITDDVTSDLEPGLDLTSVRKELADNDTYDDIQSIRSLHIVEEQSIAGDSTYDDIQSIRSLHIVEEQSVAGDSTYMESLI